MAKNVAEEIARNIVTSLQTKLLNQKTKMFSSISGIVKSTLKETLTNILTPKRKIDVLTEAAQCRERGEPYVLTFIGVNGVGKSTNLAKVAYMFKNQVRNYLSFFKICRNVEICLVKAQNSCKWLSELIFEALVLFSLSN